MLRLNKIINYHKDMYVTKLVILLPLISSFLHADNKNVYKTQAAVNNIQNQNGKDNNQKGNVKEKENLNIGNDKQKVNGNIDQSKPLKHMKKEEAPLDKDQTSTSFKDSDINTRTEDSKTKADNSSSNTQKDLEYSKGISSKTDNNEIKENNDGINNMQNSTGKGPNNEINNAKNSMVKNPNDNELWKDDDKVNSVKNNMEIVSMEKPLISSEILKNFEKNLDLSKHKQLNIGILPSKFSQVWIVNNESNITSMEFRFKNEGNRSFQNTPKLVNIVLANLIEGAGKKSAIEIKKLIEDKSIEILLHATNDDVVINVSFLSKYLNTVVDLLIDLFTQAHLPEDKVKKHIQEYKLDLLQSQFDTYEKASEKLSNMVMIPAYKYNIEKTIEKLDHYTKQDVDQCYKKLFDSKNAAITIVSDLPIDKLVLSMNKLYEAIKNRTNNFKSAKSTTELAKSEQFAHVELTNPQSTVLFALHGIDQTNENKYALKAALYLLGNSSLNSRLFDSLREKRGLVYTTGAKENIKGLQSIIIGYALTRPENVYQVIKSIKEEIANFHHNGISEDELHEFKISKFSDYVLDSSKSILSYVAGQRNNGAQLSEINQILDKYMQLTIEDVNKGIKALFDPNKIVFVSCGTDLKQAETDINEKNTLHNKEVVKAPSQKQQESSNNTSEDVANLAKQNANTNVSNVSNKEKMSDTNSSSSLSDQLDITESTLENGLKVIIAPLKTKNSVFFGVGYYVGDADDPKDLMGISHFLEHVMFKNTANLKNGEIKTYTDKFNQISNAWTDNDMTFYWQKGNKEFLDMNMKIEAERMTNLEFDQKEIDKECGAIIEERKMSCESDPRIRYIYEAANKALHLYSDYSESGIGQVKNIKACNAENLKHHYDKYYKNPKNAFVLIIGDISPEEGLRLVKKNFGHIPTGEDIVRDRTIDPENTGLLHTINHYSSEITTKQADFVYKVPRKYIQTLKQYMALQMACNMLANGGASILHQNLVDKMKLAYDVSVCLDKRSFDAGLIYISVKLANSTSFQTLEKNYLDLQLKYLQSKITSDRIEIEKNKILDGIDIMSENPYALQKGIIRLLYAGHSIEEIKNIKNIVTSITVNDVRKVANDSFCAMNRILTIRQQPATKTIYKGHSIVS